MVLIYAALSVFSMSSCYASFVYNQPQQGIFTKQEITGFVCSIARNETINVPREKINYIDPMTGKTLLHYAVRYGRQDLTAILFNTGINPMVYDNSGFLAVHEIRSQEFMDWFSRYCGAYLINDTTTRSGIETVTFLNGLWRQDELLKRCGELVALKKRSNN